MQIKKISPIVFLILSSIIYIFFILYINDHDMIDRDYKYQNIKVPIPEKTDYNGYIISKNTYYLQKYDNTCAAASLRYFLGMKNTYIQEKTIADKMKIKKDGASLLDIKKVAEDYGFNMKGYNLDINEIGDKNGIVHLKFGHFAVLVRKTSYEDNFLIFDPNYGLVFIDKRNFNKIWSGYILVIES